MSAAAVRAIVPSGGTSAMDAATIAGTGDATASVASRASRRSSARRKPASNNNNRVATAMDNAKGSGRRGRRASRSPRRSHVLPPMHRCRRSRRDSQVRRTQASMAKADADGAIGVAVGAGAASVRIKAPHGPSAAMRNPAAAASHAPAFRAPTSLLRRSERTLAMYYRGK